MSHNSVDMHCLISYCQCNNYYRTVVVVYIIMLFINELFELMQTFQYQMQKAPTPQFLPFDDFA